MSVLPATVVADYIHLYLSSLCMDFALSLYGVPYLQSTYNYGVQMKTNLINGCLASWWQNYVGAFSIRRRGMCFDMISKLVHIKTLLAPQELGPALLSHRTHGNRHPRLIGGTFEFLPDGCKAELIAVTCEIRVHCTYSINSCPSSGATKGQRTLGLNV